MFKRLRREDGASAVEFALLAPLFFMLIFGIITFGIAFMQLQTARGAVREGARYAAVAEPGTKTHKSPAQVAQRTVEASTGLIGSVSEVNASGATCAGGAGTQAVVSYDTSRANGGQGIEANLIFFSVPMNQTVTAQFMCEG
jgi:Flp pilus assembly protein TadG